MQSWLSCWDFEFWFPFTWFFRIWNIDSRIRITYFQVSPKIKYTKLKLAYSFYTTWKSSLKGSAIWPVRWELGLLFLGFGLFLICFCGFICWNRGQHFGFQNFRRNSNACNVQQRPRQSPIPFYLWCEQLCFIIISWFLFLYIIIIIIPISLHLQFLVSWLTCIFLFCVYVFSSEENSLKS